MHLRIDPGGAVTCVYGEAIDLGGLGEVSIRRGSWVEPDEQGNWWADLAPVSVLGSVHSRVGRKLWRRSATGWSSTGSPRPSQSLDGIASRSILIEAAPVSASQPQIHPPSLKCSSNSGRLAGVSLFIRFQPGVRS